jgi:hypothetical protein
MIGFVLMMVFLLGYTCCSAVESFFVPPDEPDATRPPWPDANVDVDTLGRVRAYKATGPYYKESSSPLDAVPLRHELGDGNALVPAAHVSAYQHEKFAQVVTAPGTTWPGNVPVSPEPLAFHWPVNSESVPDQGPRNFHWANGLVKDSERNRPLPL